MTKAMYISKCFSEMRKKRKKLKFCIVLKKFQKNFLVLLGFLI